jgi:hypothetical protein
MLRPCGLTHWDDPKKVGEADRPVNDNTPDEARYQALAADAFAAANHMRDPDAQLIMRKIARGYLRLASLAGNRERLWPHSRFA